MTSAAEPDLSTARLSGNDEKIHTGGNIALAEESMKHEDYEAKRAERIDIVGEIDRVQTVDPNDPPVPSRAQAKDYFSSYKPSRKRLRSSMYKTERSRHLPVHGQQRDAQSMDERPEMDDMGAMWA